MNGGGASSEEDEINESVRAVISRSESSSIDRHASYLIQEIISSDGQLASLRSVYDSEDDRTQSFMASLDQFIERIDVEIEKVCNKYYQGFIKSIDELLKVKSNATLLNNLVKKTNERLQESGHALVKTTQNLLQKRHVQRNLLNTIELLSKCLPVIRLYCKALFQLKVGRYYPALKTLQELELLHLGSETTFTFADKMRGRVPELRLSVKHASFSQLQEFLSDIRLRSTSMGQLAMIQTAHTEASNESGESVDVTINNSDNIAEVWDPLTFPASTELQASDQADFSPLYRSLHIYGVLGARGECEEYYKAERQKQVALVLEPFSEIASFGGYHDYFYQVAGFFLVEDTVLSTTHGLLSAQWVEDQWEKAVQRISRVVQSQLGRCTDPAMIFRVKELIVLFCQTMEGYGYNCGRLYEILVRVKDRYTTVLLKECITKFRNIFKADSCAPIEASNDMEFAKVLARYPFEDRIILEAPFPKAFPFSEAVPSVYEVIKRFVDLSVRFVEDLDLSHTEVDESVRKATNYLLSKTLSGTMSEVIRGERLSLQQLTQMSVNTTHLQKSCAYLERYISEETHAVGDESRVKLHGATAFKDARTAAEEKIIMELMKKIDDFFEMGDYNWTPAFAASDPSDFILDMLAFIMTTFTSLESMPVDVARTAYFSTYKHISGILLTKLTNPEIKRINLYAMQSLLIDVEACVDSAEDCPVPSIVVPGDCLFKAVFGPVYQVLELFCKWDWPRYLDQSSRQVSYSQATQVVVIRILEKFDISSTQVSPTKSGKLKALKLTPEEKKLKSEVDGAIKVLKSQVSRKSSTSQHVN